MSASSSPTAAAATVGSQSPLNNSPRRRSSPTAAEAGAAAAAAADRLKQVRESVKHRLAKVRDQQAAKLAELQRKYPQQLGPVRPPGQPLGPGPGDAVGAEEGVGSTAEPPASSDAPPRVASVPEKRNVSSSPPGVRPSSSDRLASGSAVRAARRSKNGAMGLTGGESRGAAGKPPPGPERKRGTGRFSSRRGTGEEEPPARRGGGSGRFLRQPTPKGPAAAAATAAADGGDGFLPPITNNLERPSTWPNAGAAGDGGTVDWGPVVDPAVFGTATTAMSDGGGGGGARGHPEHMGEDEVRM